MNLTKRRIEALEYDPDGPSQQIEYDDRLKGFGVRLNPGGSKAFVIRYRNEHGQTRYMTLGRFGRMTVQQARSKAMEKFVEIDAGADPAGQRDHPEAETVEALVSTYLEKYAKVHRESTWQEDKRRLTKHLVSRWGTREPESLTRSDLSALHRDIGESAQVEANRVIETARTMFNFAQDEGIVEDGFNPAEKVKRYKEGSRQRWLREDEIPALADALDGEDNPFFRDYFWLVLLTATRRGEMLDAKWEHVSIEREELFLPNTKNGTDHTVPLSTPALQILRDLPRLEGNPYVFPSPRVEGQPITNINKVWRRVRKRAGLEDVWIHDFRRTAASWLAQAGYSELIIKNLLNHTVKGPTGIYARMKTEDLREAVEDYGRKIMRAAREAEADVIDLADARGEG